MEIRKLPAAQALVWARQAIELGRRSPRAIFGAALLMLLTLYGVMVVLVAVVSSFALGGSDTPDLTQVLRWLAPAFVLMLLLLPILLGGLMHVIREAEAGRPVRARDVYAPFRQGKAGTLAVFGLVQLLFGIAGGLLVVALAGSGYWTDYLAALNGALNGSVPVLPEPAHPGLLMLVQMLFNYFSYAMLLFSIPLVLFSGTRVLDALRGSFRAAIRNIFPNLLAGLLFVGGVVVATLVLVLMATVATLIGSAIHVALGMLLNTVLLLLFGAVLLVVLTGGAYFAWRDTFGDETQPVGTAITGIEV
ncbi:MAG: hypothetical protein ACOH1R_09510 [Luteimonas sp.]